MLRKAIERLKEMLGLVRENRETIQMDVWIHHCGTTACAVGTYLQQSRARHTLFPKGSEGLQSFMKTEKGQALDDSVVHTVYEHLGLTPMAGAWLFRWVHPDGKSKSLDQDLKRVGWREASRRLDKYIRYKEMQKRKFDEWNNRLHTRHAESSNVSLALKALSKSQTELFLATAS